jgi:glycosyltransferase involved in cell wall biosynthesis
MTTLSILIPHFNDPEGLALTLKSIESQTWRGDREVVVVDDGSRPDQQAPLDAVVAATSERIRLIRNPVNRGRPYTRNVLLDAAEGKYLTWCDSGDEYYPRKLEVQLDALFAERLADPRRSVWVTCNSHWQWQGSSKKKVVTQAVAGDQISNLVLGTLRGYLYTLVGTTQSFRDVGYFDAKLPRLQDLDFFLRFAAKGGVFVLPTCVEPLCLYHKTDVGRRGQDVVASFQHIFRKHNVLLMNRSRRFRRNRNFHLYKTAARFTSNNHDTWTTALYVARSAVASPFAFGKWLVKDKGRL